MEKNHSRFLRTALVIGIVIVLNLFFNYALSLVYNEPDYTTYFKQPQVVTEITTKEDCLAIGGQWNENMYAPESAVKTAPQMRGSCDPNYTKQQQFDAAQKAYERNVFVVLIILGIISLMAGVFVANEILSPAFSWGGVLSLIIASVRYWSNADKWVHVLILAGALVALIWVSVKKFAKQ